MTFVIGLVTIVLNVYFWLIIARALLSWFPLRPGTLSYKVYGFLYDVTEPYLQIFKRVLKPLRLGGAGFDLSPFVGLLVLYVALYLLALVS